MQLRSARKYRRLSTILNEVSRHADGMTGTATQPESAGSAPRVYYCFEAAYAAAISRVALTGSFSTLHNALRFAIPWPTVIRLPEIDARLTDADLFSDFGNR